MTRQTEAQKLLLSARRSALAAHPAKLRLQRTMHFRLTAGLNSGKARPATTQVFPGSPGLRGPPLVGFVVSGLIQLPEVDDSRSACRHWRRRPARLPECGGNPGFWRRQNGVRHDLDGESAPGGRALFQGEAGTLSDSQHRRLAQDRPSLTRLGAALVSSLKNSTFYGRPPSRGPSTCGSRFSSR